MYDEEGRQFLLPLGDMRGIRRLLNQHHFEMLEHQGGYLTRRNYYTFIASAPARMQSTGGI